MADNSPAPTPRWRPTGGNGLPPSGGRVGGGRTGSARRRRALVLLALMLALAGAIVAWFLLLKPLPDPTFLTLSLAQYHDRRLPVNPFAEQDGKALAGRFGHADEPFGSQLKSTMIATLRDLRAPPDGVVIVHLCAEARVEAGEVYLLPTNANPDDPGTWLRLAEVLRLLGQCPARHKLLLLDVARPLPDPRLGVLAADVAGKVAAAVNQANDPSLHVLCACSDGQVALVSEDAGLSVFAHYVGLGLDGWADGYGGGRVNGRVSLRELAAFVTDRVDRWARLNRATIQTPVLLGADGDFDLLTRDRSRAEHPEEPPLPDSYPAWLNKKTETALQGWALRDQWLRDGTWRAAPWAFRQLEANLLWAEQRWVAGSPVDKAQAPERDLERETGILLRQVEEARRLPVPEPRSLALWKQLPGVKPDAEEDRKALRGLLARIDNSSLKPEERDKAAAGLVEKHKGKAASAALAWAALEEIANDSNPRKDKIEFLNKLLRQLDPPPVFVETVFLQGLAERLSPERWAPRAALGAVHQALEAIRLGEQAANCEPRVLPWVRGVLERAADKQREGVRNLYGPGPEEQVTEAAVLLEEAAGAYKQIQRHQALLAQAYLTYDQALAFLPDYVLYLADRAGSGGHDEDDWRDAVAQARKLGMDLTKRFKPSAAAEKSLPSLLEELSNHTRELKAVSDRLRARLEDLRQPFEKKNVDRLIGQSTQDGAPATILRDMDVLLETPLLAADDRANLWKARRDLSHALCVRTTEADAEEDRQQLRTRPGPAFDEERWRHAERLRAQRKARLLIDLLDLGGADALEIGGPRPPELDEALSRELRKAWSGLAAQLRRRLDQKDLLAADRLSRILHPFDPEAGTDLADAVRNPTTRLRRREASDLWIWLADQRYAKEAENPTGPGFPVNFFNEVANDYRSSANR